MKFVVYRGIFYISTGGKSVYYTLRQMEVYSTDVTTDRYVCNLAVDEIEAVEKAQMYVEKVKGRFLSGVEVSLIEKPEYTTSAKIAPKTPSYDERLTQIENGIVPIGKYIGLTITDLPDSYILWLAEKYTGEVETNSEKVFQALAAVALGIAIDRQLFEERQAEIDKTEHLGAIGQRTILTGIIKKYETSISYYGNVLKYTLDVGGKTAIYRGSKFLGAIGDIITIKANIAEHAILDNGYKLTYLKRPALVC